MLKKRFVFKITALVMVLVMSAASTVYALDLEKGKELVIDDEICVSDFVTHSQGINEYQSFISQQNLARLKECMDTSEISETEINKEIYHELGFSDEVIDKIGMEEINSIMESSVEITVTEQYIGVDEDGNQEVVSKEECLSAADAINAEKELELQNILFQIQNNPISPKTNGNAIMAAAAASNNGRNEETKGYMKIWTISNYINPSAKGGQKGWYEFSTLMEWITNPSQSYTDAISLYAPGCAWAQGTDAISSFTSHTEIVVTRTKTTQTVRDTIKTTKDRRVQSDGVYYTYDLPATYLDASIGYYLGFSGLLFYVRAEARVSNHTSPYAFNLYSRYEHLTKNFSANVAFGWKIGSAPGVTVTATVNNNHTTYGSYNYTSYYPTVYK